MKEKLEIEDLLYKYSEYNEDGEMVIKQVMFYPLVDEIKHFLILSHKEGYNKGFEDANHLPF